MTGRANSERMNGMHYSDIARYDGISDNRTVERTLMGLITGGVRLASHCLCERVDRDIPRSEGAFDHQGHRFVAQVRSCLRIGGDGFCARD